MFALGNLLAGLAHTLEAACRILYWLLLIRAVISWVNPDPYNPIVQFLYKSTEWMLAPIRKILPTHLRVGIDLSLIIAFLIIIFLKSFLVMTLLDLSTRLR